MIKNNFFVLFLLLPTYWAQAQEVNYNFRELYNPDSEVRATWDFVRTDSLWLYLVVSFRNDNPDDYTLDIYPAQEEKNEAPNFARGIFLGSDDEGYYYRYQITESSKLWVLKVSNKKSSTRYFYDIDPTSPFLNDILLLGKSGMPQINNWLMPNLHYHMGTEATKVYGYHYRHDFAEALPPMQTKPDRLEKSLQIDSIFALAEPDSISFSTPGLYLLQQDTTSTLGRTFFLSNKYYPRLVKLQDLVQPLIYITTKNEKIKLDNIRDSKDKFDKFWIELTNSTNRAKKIIRRYYRRVETANRYFTTYKEGWKTDKGMIYIIFGPPNEVYFKGREEIWQYLENEFMPKISFTFIETQSIFSPEASVLVRHEKYRSAWFRAVDLWRKGRF